MKIVSSDDIDNYQRATAIGGAKGFFGGLAVAGPASYILNKRWPYYRQLPPSLKAFGIILVAVPSFVIAAEHAGQKYEKDHWTGVGKVELDTAAAREQARWEALSPSEKVKDWAARHQYGVIGGSWALSMVGSFGWIMRDPHQSFAQKIVQARMWAQGLTIGVLLAAGAISHANRHNQGSARNAIPDHSWKDILEQEERVQQEARAAQSASTSASAAAPASS
ncbi:hypothetical protein GLOTRDRAFT_70022 [Gloeophyllum trabeum ATCC 11539]|uniref:HIG1 domain-containing protein n=1 Tax=Gloeophyllum trabeum (strain ATCC 11539 / FP-39264 / Madison 617) TaxID=670483 RepID=S7RZV6_GLOTA|nr:uncharacterized protein GLOTRDRAFT_70022 [Gloeophyllum trabeum ATCC 11539]EPQ58964.1 hypothetical protein GLOTRDRAFT_70022 [Gloeophyllum trabeum ATCC 11539]